MTLRFIVAVEPLSKDQEKEFREYVVALNGTWWHWIGNFWLLKFNDGAVVSADDIWRKLIKLNPAARIFVSLTTETDWTITDIKTAEGKRMASWLEKHWMGD